METDRVLETKQDQLDLVDVGGVKVQVQLELGDGGGHHASLWRMDEVAEDADDLLDVLHRELELLAALQAHTDTHHAQLDGGSAAHAPRWQRTWM